MVAKLPIALSLACALAHDLASAFAPSSTTSCLRAPPRIRTSSAAELPMTSSFFADATAPKTPEEKVQVDANGNEFVPGMSVAIAPSDGIKAYAVPKKAYGSFDPSSGEFVPQDGSNVTRGTSCLVLPAGLRGVVEKIYNTNEWDRAHPILVKFTAGADREGGGGLDVPTKFKMHFDADEIEVIG